MTEFQFNSLPDGFRYPVSLESIQELVSSTHAVINSVLFSGFPEVHTPGFASIGVVLCTVEAQCFNASYFFNIEFNGVRIDKLEGNETNVSCEIKSQVKGWIENKAQQSPPKHYQTPTKLKLVLDMKNKKFLLRSIISV